MSPSDAMESLVGVTERGGHAMRLHHQMRAAHFEVGCESTTRAAGIRAPMNVQVSVVGVAQVPLARRDGHWIRLRVQHVVAEDDIEARVSQAHPRPPFAADQIPIADLDEWLFGVPTAISSP